MRPAAFFRLIGLIAAGFLALIPVFGARAESEAFLGHWQNPAPGLGGLIHIAISPNGGRGLDVRAYGDCHPMECDWGMVEAKIFTPDPKSSDVQVVVATFHYGFAHRQLTLRKADGGLAFEMLTEFADNSRRHDFAVSGILRPTAWVGPTVQNWQSEPGLTTGWGGGALTGAARAPAENCTPVNTHGAKAVRRDGAWKVLAGTSVLADAGKDEKTARLVETVFRYYRFDRLCTVGGPFKAYWKRGEGFPASKMGGISCRKFHPNTAHLVKSGGAWQIADGTATIADLGPLEDKANAMLGLIRAKRLTSSCFVRWPDPLVSFWLAE